MQYRTLGSSGMQCSVVALGTWAFGGDSFGTIVDSQCIDTVHKALDVGVNFIDTAPAYGDGHSEELIGKALKGKREKALVATKCGTDRDGKAYFNDGSPAHIRKQLERSLRLLDTDYIDLYQMHWPDPNHPFEDTFREFAKMQQEGKIRHIGVSNFTVQQMEQIKDLCAVVSLQPPYSLLDRRIEHEILPYCDSNGIGILSYGSIGAGVLTGKFKERPTFLPHDPRNGFYPFFSEENWPRTKAMVTELEAIAQTHSKPAVHVAINWVLAQSPNMIALVGAKTVEQMADNAGAADWELSKDELERIEKAYQRIFDQR